MYVYVFIWIHLPHVGIGSQEGFQISKASPFTGVHKGEKEKKPTLVYNIAEKVDGIIEGQRALWIQQRGRKPFILKHMSSQDLCVET